MRELKEDLKILYKKNPNLAHKVLKVLGYKIVAASKVNIDPKWKNKQMMVLKELYNFREILGDKLTLLNEPYVRSMNKSIIKIQKQIKEVYNALTPLANFYEKS